MRIISNILNLFKKTPLEVLEPVGTKGSVPLLKADIFAILAQVGKAKGVDPSLLIAIANIESSLNPLAKATTSSATGLFQFIESTWVNLVKIYGKENGFKDVTIEDRKDPKICATFMCELILENKRYLEGKGLKDLSKTDLYLAHFLGPKKAMQFIAQKRSNGKIKGITMFPQEAKANEGVFLKGVEPRTLDSIYDLFTDKLKDYGV